MAQSYAEYLKSMGASDEDLKTLVTPVTTKAFDKIQADLAEAERLRGIAQDDFNKMNDWYNDKALPSYEAKQQEVIRAQAEAARLAAIVKSAQDQGLLEIAKTMDDNKNGGGNGNNNPNPGNPGFDPNKYMAKDEFAGLADKVGGNLAKMQDAVLEHMQLFPNQRLNVSALREEAAKAGKDFYTMWEQKYNVPATREAAAKAAHDAELAAARKEGEDAAMTRYISQQANPDTRTPAISSSPFAMRPATGRDKQPWEKGDMSGERVERATRKVMADIVH